MSSQRQQQQMESGNGGRHSKCRDWSTLVGFEDGERRSRPKECGWPLEAEAGMALSRQPARKQRLSPTVCKEVNPANNLDK